MHKGGEITTMSGWGGLKICDLCAYFENFMVIKMQNIPRFKT